MQLWNEKKGEAHALLHKNWDYPNQGASKYCLMISWIHTTSSTTNMFPLSVCVIMRMPWFNRLICYAI